MAVYLRAAEKPDLDSAVLEKQLKHVRHPHTISEPVTRAGSPIETGSRDGVAPTRPNS